MPNGLTRDQIRRRLSKMSPAADDASLGAVVYDLLATVNNLVADMTALRAKYNATLAKLDLDAGVTDTNYTAINAGAALTATAVVLPEAR